MKTRISLAIVMLISIAIISCKKGGQQESFSTGNGNMSGGAGTNNITVDCTPIVLSGTISTNTTLLTGKTYLLRGTVVVDGATLTIQPGTLILGEKSTYGGLVIKKNAQINAVGTVSNPIVFTSDQAAGSRAVGDWFGVAILGDAPNNQSNSINITVNSVSYPSGGTSATHNSGSLEFAQIHFAGGGGGAGSDILAESSLILSSVGSGTTIRNIEITNSKYDGLGVWGGMVGVKQVFSYKSLRNDFFVSQGYRGNLQSLLGMKDDAVNPYSFSYGMRISNFEVGSDNSPYTYPTISNISLLGGSYCENGDTDYKDAIIFDKNGNARIFNSVVQGYSRYGLLLNSGAIVGKTASGTDPLEFSNNTIHDVATQYFANMSGSWAANNGCRDNLSNTMTDWITGALTSGCKEAGNQFSLTTTGYYSNLCDNKCSSFPNLFVNTSTTELEDPDYSTLPVFFDQPTFRGALQSSTNTWLKSTWIDFCMQSRNYCL